ncbi:L-glutamate gamma-semialdehyde dehydrogenase [Portibacter lacus]|uniref:L-glutamate gamma-semialdehyde dehydrogenase n=1 Tax=Portibacter lacus TaxID=1099794 RepID=A0AA37WDS8_9BACT|nr:L-glutamate gamma-semialdehyde dehydrogenase [Portibacter lacus]GLR15929.1 1-pyrroline-5-carboxylate dehydrogenase [Portibacter lacus]
MSNAFFEPPLAVNEPIYDYAPGTECKDELKQAIRILKSTEVDVPMFIDGKEVRTGNKISMHPPYEHAYTLGHFHMGDKSHVESAIDAALAARKEWGSLPWQDRAAIFLKAADLIAGPYRARMNAATMLCQSKNAYQSEIDAVCELIDFLRFNVQFMTELYAGQPESAEGVWNRLEYRPLEGFVFAITPFNFTAIAGNLCAAPAMMGNTVVWKPAESQVYSAALIMEIFMEAGLPDGVINMILVDGPVAGDVVFSHKEFAGLHFTGSTGVFQHLWKTIGNNISNYKSYPRIVGETGGKDFVVAHNSAHPDEVATALARGAFEFQGQKCSAASRAYVPASIWDKVWEKLASQVKSFKMGSPEDFTNFINAVIDEKSFDKISGYIENVKKSDDAEIIIGGGCDKSKGYFIEPTIIRAKNPRTVTMCEEIFGPVLTIYVYEDDQFEEILKICDETSPYALTGSILAKDRNVINYATKALENSAGNFYINDKPTGAVVGQQPFGGGRASGTNDKAGSILNLYRWVSPRTIKETFVTPRDYQYPFLGEE